MGTAGCTPSTYDYYTPGATRSARSDFCCLIGMSSPWTLTVDTLTLSPHYDFITLSPICWISTSRQYICLDNGSLWSVNYDQFRTDNQ
jgi:hypothetical protein